MDILSNIFQAFGTVIIVGLLVLVILFAVRQGAKRYRIVQPNQALVVSGRGKKDAEGVKTGARVITAGGTFIWPIIEEFTEVPMNVITISQTNDEIYDLDGLKFLMDWVAQVQVEPDEAKIITHSRAFTGMEERAKVAAITETLSTNFRAICGRNAILTIHKDRDQFVKSVQELAVDEMQAMGLRIISMGVKDIKDPISEEPEYDEKGHPIKKLTYFEALAAPKIAAIRKEATVAQATADREARVKAANEGLAAQQAEIQAQTTIIEQNEAKELRDVARAQKVALANQDKDKEVAEKQALAAEKQQEATVIVPAKKHAESLKIVAEGERQKLEVEALGRAKAAETNAEGTAKATKLTADATSEATRKTGIATADAERAKLMATADGTRAQLTAEADGKRKLADAVAAQGQINLRQLLAEAIIAAEVEKARAYASALGTIGANVKIVQFAGGDGQTGQGNALMQLLSGIPEFATVLNAKSEALTGQNLEQLMARVLTLLKTGEVIHPVEEASSEESPASTEEPAATEDATEPAPTEEVTESPATASPLSEEPPTQVLDPLKEEKHGRGSRRPK